MTKLTKQRKTAFYETVIRIQLCIILLSSLSKYELLTLFKVPINWVIWIIMTQMDLTAIINSNSCLCNDFWMISRPIKVHLDNLTLSNVIGYSRPLGYRLKELYTPQQSKDWFMCQYLVKCLHLILFKKKVLFAVHMILFV